MHTKFQFTGRASFVYDMVYGACFTGEGGEKGENIVNATFEKGAKIVIGFQGKTDCPQENTWTKAFMEALAANNTVEAAIAAANKKVESNPGGTNNQLKRGTTAVRINMF